MEEESQFSSKQYLFFLWNLDVKGLKISFSLEHRAGVQCVHECHSPAPGPQPWLWERDWVQGQRDFLRESLKRPTSYRLQTPAAPIGTQRAAEPPGLFWQVLT